VSSWRERFLIRCGPGVGAGITLADWLQLLRENRFAVEPSYLVRAASISLCALTNSVFRWFDDRRCRALLNEVTVPPPLFVLGHWRSGTTHLHYLLGRDDRFACPTFYQVMYPHTFLSTEGHFSALQRVLLQEHRPYDNVRWDLNLPCEEEFAMCVWGFRTHYLSGMFPRRADYYDRFLTLGRATPREVEQWKAALLLFLQKVTLKERKPLILKSPAHTGRIKLLLELFPGAKFVHIHRDPYAVFQSYQHTLATGLPYGRLQRTDRFDWVGRTIRQYKELYDAFFEQRALIPRGHFHEVRYEVLERDPVGEVRSLYAALGLPCFGHVEPDLCRYVESLTCYRKNVFPQLPPNLRRLIAAEWRRSFEEWGYPT